MAESLREAVASTADSDLYDDAILSSFEAFGRLFRRGVHTFELTGAANVRVVVDDLQTFAQLRRDIPAVQRVILAGKLDTLGYSERVFSLVLEGG